MATARLKLCQDSLGGAPQEKILAAMLAALPKLLQTSVVVRSFRNFSSKMVKKACVLLAAGAEEMEFVITVDVLRRGGVDVTVAGLPDKQPVKCSRGVVIIPDVGVMEAVDMTFDALVLPGGLGGSKALADSDVIGRMLRQQEKAGKIVAAICAAPTALKAHGIGFGKSITSYPSMEGVLTEGGSYVYKQDDVVVDGTLITSRGPGTAYSFGLTVLEALVGADKRTEVAKGLLLEN